MNNTDHFKKHRGSGTLALLGIVSLIVIIGGGALYLSKEDTSEEVMMDDEAMMEEGEMMDDAADEHMDDADEHMMDDTMSDDGEMMDDGAMMDDTMSDDGEMMEEGEMMDDTSTMMDDHYEGELLAGTEKTPLLAFTKADYDRAVASDKLVALYFYANWCPICRAEFPKMQAAFDGLEHDNVIGFRVNYNDNETDDAEEALAREFGVAYQHTKVFVKDGERVLKSPESWDEARYTSEINALVN